MLVFRKIYITFLTKRRITKEDKVKSYRFGFSPAFFILVFFISVFIIIRLIFNEKNICSFFLDRTVRFSSLSIFLFLFLISFLYQIRLISIKSEIPGLFSYPNYVLRVLVTLCVWNFFAMIHLRINTCDLCNFIFILQGRHAR